MPREITYFKDSHLSASGALSLTSLDERFSPEALQLSLTFSERRFLAAMSL